MEIFPRCIYSRYPSSLQAQLAALYKPVLTWFTVYLPGNQPQDVTVCGEAKDVNYVSTKAGLVTNISICLSHL